MAQLVGHPIVSGSGLWAVGCRLYSLFDRLPQNRTSAALLSRIKVKVAWEKHAYCAAGIAAGRRPPHPHFDVPTAY